jgi:hypothetical protein
MKIVITDVPNSHLSAFDRPQLFIQTCYISLQSGLSVSTTVKVLLLA